jgi:phosphopentomutase
LLGKNGIPTVLLGKVADIVVNPYGKSISCVDSTEVLDLTIQAIQDYLLGFICTNVQETDLAGHSMNTQWYKELLEIVDRKLGEIVPLLEEQDLLVVMADHGNDPEIGHNRHTREHTPLLVYSPRIKGKHLNIRDTMADVGASACDYFSVERTEFGVSFLSELI